MNRIAICAAAATLFVQAPAFARIGSTVPQSISIVKHYRGAGDIDASFWTDKGRVIAETWATDSPWKMPQADAIRRTIVGQRRLVKHYIDGEIPTFVYSDGTTVTYQPGDGGFIINMDVTAKGYHNEDLMPGGKYPETDLQQE